MTDLTCCSLSLITELVDNVIELLNRCTYWAVYASPILERVKGWHAHLSNDKVTASYHLNRSLLEARRLQLNHQEAKCVPR